VSWEYSAFTWSRAPDSASFMPHGEKGEPEPHLFDKRRDHGPSVFDVNKRSTDSPAPRRAPPAANPLPRFWRAK